jgi:protein-S-isoprenylcysteine O-methyltransferase Ste14
MRSGERIRRFHLRSSVLQETIIGDKDPPRSVVGEIAFLPAFCLLLIAAFAVFHFQIRPFWGALLLLLSYAMPSAAYSIFVESAHLRTSTGLDWSRVKDRVDQCRIRRKLAGGTTIIAILIPIYAAVPFIEYRLFLKVAIGFSPLILPAMIAYIVFIDRLMIVPEDGLYQLGSLVLLNRACDLTAIRDFLLGWMIKGFFLPLMFVSLVGTIQSASHQHPADFTAAIQYLMTVIIAVELAIAVCGYSLTLRVLDCHIRSPNPTFTGWIACMACYPPMNWITFGILFPFRPGTTWLDWFSYHLWLAVPWGLMISCLYGLHLWATVIYGLRWSNLTNRGIVTSGPYRYFKHPDYLAKSLFWWLTYVPFLSEVGLWPAVFRTTALLLANATYWARAKTEERHLNKDPDYLEYSEWIEQNGILPKGRRFIARILLPGSTSKHPGHKYKA